MTKNVTLRDVAAEAGVSLATASLVLNNRPVRISEQKRQAVTDAAAKLQYVPNQAARSLVTRRSMLVALVIPDIENMFFASFAKEVEDFAAADGYSIIVANSDDSRAREQDLVAKLSSRGVDGMLLVPSRETYADTEGLRADIEAVPEPVVLVDRCIEVPWCDGIGFDDREGGRVAAQALLKAGHTHIGCISGGKPSDVADMRFEGFSEALREAGVAEPNIQMAAGDYHAQSGYEVADALLHKSVTAVFCANDLMALGFMQRAGELGIDIPGDVSLVGYDDVLQRFGLMPNLTTVRQDIALLAESCWEFLKFRMGYSVDKTANEQRVKVARGQEGYTIKLRPELVERATVAAPRV